MGEKTERMLLRAEISREGSARLSVAGIPTEYSRRSSRQSKASSLRFSVMGRAQERQAAR